MERIGAQAPPQVGGPGGAHLGRPGERIEVDVAVVGGGVVGTAIARELSRYRVRTALLEAGPDIGAGTSKASTAILHTGFDATPGSLEARLVRRGWELWGGQGPELGVPIERTGALLVAWTAEEAASLGPIEEKARANGYEACRRLDTGELYALEPHLGPGALAALTVPDEGITCTFTAPLAFATDAIVNGVTLRLESPLVGLGRTEDGRHLLVLPDERRVEARWVVNAAGLRSDEVDRLFGHDRFTVRPRRGELIVFDKFARRLVTHVILPVPTKVTKGVLVSPTVYGNVILGPTAEEIEDKGATGTTPEGLAGLLEKGRRIMPALLDEEVTATYVGLRAATEHADYRLFGHPDQRYVCVGGIRSTGLTASPAIAEHVVGLLAQGGLALEPVAATDRRTIRMPNIGEAGLRPYADPDARPPDPAEARIVCFCERTTLGEIREALAAPVPARDADGLRRRTRAGLGRCQGFYCGNEVAAELAAAGALDAGTGR